MKLLAIALIASMFLAAQPPSDPPAKPAKVCMVPDIEAGHPTPVPCKPSRTKKLAARVHHDLTVAGEVGIGVAIFVLYLYAKARV